MEPGTKIGALGAEGGRFLDNQRIEGALSQILDGIRPFVNRNQLYTTAN